MFELFGHVKTTVSGNVDTLALFITLNTNLVQYQNVGFLSLGTPHIEPALHRVKALC